MRDAFARYRLVYHGQRDWSIDHRVETWSIADQAFNHGDAVQFEALYHTLRTQWQVFRPSGQHWNSQAVYEVLAAHADRDRLLSGLNADGVSDVWAILLDIAPIKTLKHGPSVVAVSKFLHFWNPSMFVIVDDAIMWRQVLSLPWIRGEVQAATNDVGRLLNVTAAVHPYGACDLLSYMGITWWCAHFIRAHPRLMPLFVEHMDVVRPRRPGDPPWEHYEAAAVEWLLLGLAAMPPCGVEAADWR